MPPPCIAGVAGAVVTSLEVPFLPTKLTVTRKLMFITETNSELSINDAINIVRGELTDAGYEDNLKDDSDKNKSIQVRLTISRHTHEF